MDTTTVGVMWFVGVFFLTIVVKIPLGPSLGLCGFFGLVSLHGFSTAGSMVGYMAWEGTVNYTFSAVPLFILMGSLASATGVSSEAFWGIRKWMGRLPGGLAVTTVFSCGAFAAVSGSSLATVTSIGTIAFSEMRKYEYDKHLALGCIAAGGTLGGMIPPSIPLVIIAMLTEQSTGKVLMAGFMPGLLEIVVYSVIIVTLSIINPSYGPRSGPSTWREKILGLGKLWKIVVLFLSVMGGIYLGIFTPTEGAALGAFFAAVLAVITRKVTRKNAKRLLQDTGVAAATLMMVLVGALIFNTFMASSRLPMVVSEWIGNLQASKWEIMFVIILLYLFLGCTMDTLAMILLTVPITFPIVVHNLGFNGIWYAIITERLIEIAIITPPIGMGCFALQAAVAGFEKIPIGEVFKGIMPFLVGDFICLAILLAFPEFVLFVPNMMGK